jgi:hypothetical protein
VDEEFFKQWIDMMQAALLRFLPMMKELRNDARPEHYLLGSHVIYQSSAGIYFGRLISADGPSCVLEECRASSEVHLLSSSHSPAFLAARFATCGPEGTLFSLPTTLSLDRDEGDAVLQVTPAALAAWNEMFKRRAGASEVTILSTGASE